MASAHLQPDESPLDYVRRQIATGKAPEAASKLAAMVEAHRGGLLSRLALVEALSATGDHAQAVTQGLEANRLYPGIVQTVTAYGKALLAAQVLAPAITEFNRALRIDPQSVEARLMLAKAWLAAGEPQHVIGVVGGLPSDNLERAALLQAAQTMKTQARSDAGYVRHLFDQFSADYDARMRGTLAFRAPEILRELADVVMPGRKALDVLDLGCGTGLCGAVFCSRAARLDGIDLSPEMVAKARAREIYDRLEVGELESTLSGNTDAYDLLLASDTLVYLGDLGSTIEGAAHTLRPGGFFLFTVERGEEADFELGPKRRWRHSGNYLRHLAASAGLHVAGLIACSPRTEAGVAVEGLAAAFSKPE